MNEPQGNTVSEVGASTAGQRREFEMSADDLSALLNACRSVPLIAIHCGPISSPQENANRAWCALGDRMGFDGMTVLASTKGDQFFTAIAKATGTTDTHRDSVNEQWAGREDS